jgi:hypothetical protein
VVVAVVETAGELLAGVVLTAVGDGVAVVLTLVGDVLDGVDVGLLVLVLVVLVEVVEGEVDVTNVVVVDAALEKLVVALAITDETPVVEVTPVTPEIVKRAE